MLEQREMELAGILQEMICLGWTLDSFDQDFDSFEGEDFLTEEKEDCRRIFKYLWEDR